MSRTGGGRGTNGYKIRGSAKQTNDGGAKAEQKVSPASVHDPVYGSSPIDPDHFEFLLPEHSGLTTLSELNEVEAFNIAEADAWLGEQDVDLAELLSQAFLRELHRRMFSEVWTWAGMLRSRETNLGVDPHQISVQWELLLGNMLWQLNEGSTSALEVGVRLHHDMLKIHCFTNGNGRHARLATNKLAEIAGLGVGVYTWGQRGGGSADDARERYVDALRHADTTNDFGPLIAVATS